VHAVLASELLTVDRSFLEAAPELLVVARYGVGLDAIDLAACTEAGVLVTVTPEGIIRPVASAAMALMLNFAHQLDARRLTGPTSDWDSRRELVATGLSGSTLGIVGLGRIGAELARLARPFGVRLIGCDPHTSAETASTLGLELTDLEQLLRGADLVCLCCPLTVETRHMISTEALNAMKPTAYLINVARGGLIDERALEQALADNTIAGAGLDVFELEPLPRESPLRTLPNVVPTPHSLAWTEEYFRQSGRSAADAVHAVATGTVPTHVANPDVLRSQRLQTALRHRRSIHA
jgi:phosphoglycerate dehydrogenase-like enzyme